MSTARVFGDATQQRAAGGIRAAIDAIVLAAARIYEERARREAVARLIRVTDGMIAEAEELNLREVRYVPDRLRMRAQLVFGLVGFEATSAIRLRPTPTGLIDALFDAQQLLFDAKVGAGG